MPVPQRSCSPLAAERVFLSSDVGSTLEFLRGTYPVWFEHESKKDGLRERWWHTDDEGVHDEVCILAYPKLSSEWKTHTVGKLRNGVWLEQPGRCTFGQPKKNQRGHLRFSQRMV